MLVYRHATLLGLLLALAFGCGSSPDDGGGGGTPGHDDPLPNDPPGGSGGGIVTPPPPKPQPEPEPDPEVWQAGFHQALRWTMPHAGPTTHRIKVPVARAGATLKLAFRGGDHPSRISSVHVAHADEEGRLAGPAIPVLFGGQPAVSLARRQRVESDPVSLAVSFRQEIYVSFVAEGELAAGAIDLFPDSYSAYGNQASAASLDGAEEQPRAVGLASILVHGPRQPAFVAIGDSITEAYVSGRDDYRRSWPQIAEEKIGLPIANAGVSGQGIDAGQEALAEEVFVLPNVTDCLVMIGTNDIWARHEDVLNRRLQELFDELAPFCAVWAGTLPPKDRPEIDAEIRRRRRAVNDWLRYEARVNGVIDFERVLGVQGNPDLWLPGLAEDGVHPSVQGQAVMGEEAARFLLERIARGEVGR